MSAFGVGHICIVMAGRRKGSEVKIEKVIEPCFVLAKDSKGKERKYSMKHLEPKIKAH